MTVDGDKSDLLPSMAVLLEECYGKQKGFFAYEPEKSIKVILLHPADFKFRGLTRWLPNVISHELGHIFTLRKMGVKSRFFGFRLFHEWKGSSASRLEESYSYSHQDIPPWLAEGLAQYAATLREYDTLDSRRRMVIRTAAKTKTLLPYVEMEAFAWDAMRNEMVYTQGFGFLRRLRGHPGNPYVALRFPLSDHQIGRRGIQASRGGDTTSGIFEYQEGTDRDHAVACGDGTPEPFQSMLTRKTSHEVEFSIEAKTLAFFSRPEFWTLGLRFDARDFRRDPVWRLFLSL